MATVYDSSHTSSIVVINAHGKQWTVDMLFNMVFYNYPEKVSFVLFTSMFNPNAPDLFTSMFNSNAPELFFTKRLFVATQS